ncbi:MAG: alpha-N-acetylglucosaminidase TIM-barrel domain-containing protein [Bacteroidales bacterium]|nr:alpha-N-acetylglucosaminidase TIM-barrel domain-containing protein [Bacteroidales bacterium]
MNHYAHINLTWNNLTTDLSQVTTLPLPASEEKHVSSAKYRYDFNTCTFSYSMAFWTWDRWQKEIDWMALHGINAPLNLVGLDVVTRNFLKELGMSDSDIAAYIAGPGFIAWFAMNNLEGWGGTINSESTGVNMNGNPDWWYTRQEQLCKNMLQRMRELGMQPVIPGFSGQIPNSLSNYTITGFSSGDVINGGTWAGGYTRPDILHPNSSSYATLAPIYYKHLEAIMGVSEFYSMDPFHEGGLPDAVTNATCYPPIMAALDTYHNAVEDATKTSYKVSTEDNQAKWIIQYWQNIPQTGAFSSMSSYGDRFIGLDLFSDNIYADNAAKWREADINKCYYKGRPYIYCMLHNFGGRSGLHGRLETTMDGYFQALANNNNCQGIGATPEGTETNPILYDMLFELPWMDVNSRPTADEWLEEYAYSRYGVSAEKAPNGLAALQNLKKSVWDCKVNQQGTSEAVILARPNWTIGSVSAWSTSAIYWDTQDVRLAADQLISIADLVTEEGGESGVANYNYDAIDVIRQAMVDYAAELLPLINAARGNDAEYTRLYTLYLDLMLDLDEMLSYDENFKLERWTSLARNIADEVNGTTENDRNWLEWNARTQVTVWSKGNTDLHDYSNRCWAGLIKDFHYKRWKHFFENNGNAPSGDWYSGFEYPWTVDFNEVYDYAGDYSQIVIPTDMSATAKAAETFGKYFGRVKGAKKNYIFPMGVETNATKSDVIPEVYRGQTVKLPLVIGKEVTVSSVQIDLNGDGAMGNGETLTATDMNVTIPDDAAIGKTKAIVTFSDGTVITFNLAIIVDITVDRTVTAATADANMGTVAIEGTNELTITNTETVKITATANTGYNFRNWTIQYADTTVVSNDNPYIYYGETDASFTANFIEDKWGVVSDNSYTSEIATIKQYKSYVHNMTFAYYNREAETIYEATDAPTSVFTTIPQIINVPQGASFDVYYDDGDGTGLQYCYFRAYIDLNADGDFDDDGEQLKEVGTQGAENTAVCSNKINVLLPYDTPLGITHMRLRFDGAYSNSEKPAELGAKDGSNRPVYEIILNITDKTDKAAHVTVKTSNEEWGTVEVWTDETPDGSTGTEWDVSSNIPLYLRATKRIADTEFLGWYDHYGRLLTKELEYDMYAREDATYTAKFNRTIEIGDWVFEYRTEGQNVILTKVRQSGSHNLVIPERVEILGVQCPITGFDNGLFANNKDLWTITLPSTIETVSSNVVFSTSVQGENTPTATGDYNPDNKIQLIDLGFTLKNSEAWEIIATYESNGVSTFNQWGSPLLYPNGNGTGSELFYLSNINGWSSCWHVRAPFTDLGNDYFKDLTNTKISTFIAAIENKGNGKAVITITNSEGQSQTSREVTFSYDNISAFSAKLPTGLDITNFEVLAGPVPDPFEGCTNLLNITVADGCDYYVTDRKFYSPDGTMLHTLADEEKAEELLALDELIDLTNALIEEVTVSVNPTGKATEIALSATQGENYYIYSNAEIAEGAIGNLLDENNGSYIHTTWQKNSADGQHHYLRVYLGEEPSLKDFSFSYVTRDNSTTERPKQITVAGCDTENGTYNTIDVLTDLPNAQARKYESPVYSVNGYKYLRFMVDDTYRDLGHSGHKAYSMAKFDLYSVSSSAEVAPKYKNLAGVTAADVEEVYDSMADALRFYNNGGTADELQASYDALKPLYDALNVKKDRIFNGVYNINFGGKPLFIAYVAANDLNDLNGSGNAGFRLFDATTTNTDSKHSTIQNNAIAAQAPADALFTIVPKDDYSGYHLQAQGLYMNTVLSGWSIQAFDTNVANAGVYLFEETETDIFKIKSKTAGVPYMNDWGPVFGNDLSSKENLSTFTLSQVTEYTLNVPASGVTTLCLPFNVVLPAGVTAYDITEAQIIPKGSRYIYELNNVVAAEGETLAKNTPVIIKAAEGKHTFTITMSDENVKGSASGSVLRSGLVRTTINNTVFNYTFNDGTFSLVTGETEVAANQCWMELAVDHGAQILDESSYSGAFFYTTDESNPVLYKIFINRDDAQGNDKVLQFDEESKKVAVKEKAENMSYQAWYFMESTNGFVIKPYNAMGKVLSASSANNAAEAVSAQVAGDQTYYEWTLIDIDESDYYAIKVHGAENYFSNNGGVDKKMGFWNGDPYTTDGGSQFKFIDAEFENNNPRYYQLKDYLATKQDGSQLLEGVEPGCTPGSNDYHEAYMNAKELVGAGNTAAAEECYNAYIAMRGVEYPTEPMIMPVHGAVYRIKSFVEKVKEDDLKKQVHYVAVNEHAGFQLLQEAPEGNSALWICYVDGDKFKFVSALGTAAFGFRVVAETEQEYTITAGTAPGALNLYGTANLALRNEDHGSGLGFDQGIKGQHEYWSTDWYLETVGDISAVGFTKIMPKGNHFATLYLPYNVTVPAGVTAYTATIGNKDKEAEGIITLDAVTGSVIPARTAVVLHRESNTEAAEFTFNYTETANDAYDGNLFGGRITTGYVGSAPGQNDDDKYYLLLNSTNGEALYKMYREYNENGTYAGENSGGYIRCEANKGYMKLTGAAPSSYSFRFPGTTAIEEVKGENGNVKAIYDLQGRKLSEITEPGIYIIDGKKVFIK